MVSSRLRNSIRFFSWARMSAMFFFTGPHVFSSVCSIGWIDTGDAATVTPSLLPPRMSSCRFSTNRSWLCPSCPKAVALPCTAC
jgi:hypothetical protein